MFVIVHSTQALASVQIDVVVHIFFFFISVNPLTSNIREKILLSCPVTFLIKVLWRSYYNIRKFKLGDHIFNSHDFMG